MSSKSTRKPSPGKATDRPKKPYPEFPLSPHASGAWQKKICGNVHYFGRWGRVVNGRLTRIEGDGWKEALESYNAQADHLHAGRTPRVKGDGLKLKYLCEHFLTAMLRRLETSRKMSPRMFAEYKATTHRLIAKFGKTRLVDDLAADDFAALGSDLAEQFGPVRLGNEIQKVRTIFKYGIDNGLFEKAIRYGSEFKKPDKNELRRHRAKNGKRTFEADELRKLIDAAGVPLKAMLLLGINAGFGNHDIATLPILALDLDGGWVSYARPKTGIERRCPVWPETVAALRDAIATRPEHRQDEAKGLVFVTTRGRPWLVNGIANPVSVAARDLMKTAGIHHGGIGFYTLRHTFRTVADATKDPNAIRLIMGHTDDSIDANYTHGIDDGRLRVVAEHVRSWLWPKPATDRPAKAKQQKPRTSKAKRLTTARSRETDAGPALRLYVG